MILALLVVTFGVSFLILRRRKKPYFIASFAGKHVLITGASSGIGLALSKKSLQEGAFVTLVARNSAKLEQAAGSLLKDLQCSPDRILTKVADVGDYASIARVMEEALAWRPIDVLMCNAGVTRTGFFEDVKLKDINSIVQTNLLGAIYTVHASLPSLKQHSRTHPVSIVFIASLASLWLFYGSSVYTGTKHALKGIAESLALELLPFNMRVNLVCPGFTESPMLDDVSTDPELVEGMKVASFYNRKQAQSAEEVAEISIAGIKAGSFLITTTPYLGSLLSVLGRGLVPADSLVKNILEAIACVPLRMITFFSAGELKTKLVNIHQKHNSSK